VNRDRHLTYVGTNRGLNELRSCSVVTPDLGGRAVAVLPLALTFSI
jgi:hypothetical protein